MTFLEEDENIAWTLISNNFMAGNEPKTTDLLLEISTARGCKTLVKSHFDNMSPNDLNKSQDFACKFELQCQ